MIKQATFIPQSLQFETAPKYTEQTQGCNELWEHTKTPQTRNR